MVSAGFLLVFGGVFLAIGAVILAYPDAVPNSGMVSPNDIESDPESAAAQARRWNQLRGSVAVVIGLGFLLAGLAVLF